MKKIVFGILIALFGLMGYLFLFGKLFAFSPAIIGFYKHELTNTIVYTQKGSEYNDFAIVDTLIPSIESFHELKFLKKPEIFVFHDSLTYIHHSLSKARFCAFSSGRLFISPWALKEARAGEISLITYIKHELSHVLILQNKGIFSEFNYPKWLLEGIATYSANQMGTSFYPDKDETYKAIEQGNFIPPFDFKTKREKKTSLNVIYRITFMYSEFACIVDYLVEKYGKEKFLLYMKGLIRDNRHDKIFKQIYGIDFKESMAEFKKYVIQYVRDDSIKDISLPGNKIQLMGNRFLTFNAVIRVNQIEVSRDKNVGNDERSLHTPSRVIKYREAIESGFPGAKITWAFSWLALHDTSTDYIRIRELVVGYHYKYGDDITFIPGAYFANAYNTTEQVNTDLHDGLAKVSEIVGNGFRPQSIVAGFLSAVNQEYLAEKEGIHVCQGNIWSQYAIDNQDGDGSVSYPYYPSKEHFCKPAQGKADFIDCVNLDGWTMDFLAARREGFADGFNSRMGVGPIETLGKYGLKTGVEEMLHTTAIHFDSGYNLNGFAWVTNCWEVSLPIDVSGLKEWLSEIKKRWPDVKFITQGEFGSIWRSHFKSNDFNYQFEEKGSGIGGSDSDLEIRWFMNKNFRLALIRNKKQQTPEKVIDFTRYDLPAREPAENTRRWSLLGDINQKQTRPQDKPVPFSELSADAKSIIRKYYPFLFQKPVN